MESALYLLADSRAHKVYKKGYGTRAQNVHKHSIMAAADSAVVLLELNVQWD